LNIFVKYVSGLLHQWIASIFFLLDLLALVLIALGSDIPVSQELLWLILALSYIVANYRLFSQQTKRIEEYENEEANIVIEATKTSLSYPTHGGASPYPDVKVGEYGFTDNGLPGWATIITQLEFRNTGYEEGGVEWSIDFKKTKLPPFFRIEDDSGGSLISFSDRFRNRIEARKFNISVSWPLNLRIYEENPEHFAKALKASRKSKYKVVIKYRTDKVIPDSTWRKLEIKGDVSSFYKGVLEFWKNSEEFSHLFELANSEYN
jgi:hypothetical protein